MTPNELLHPQLVAFVETMAVPDMTLEHIAMIREVDMPAISSDAVDVTDHVVPGEHGEPDVAVRVLRPTGVGGALPCLYWVHGGGFVVGTASMDDARLADLCPALGMTAASVEYRLAPETPYPGPLEDCYRGLRWLHDRADDLGVDRTRIGIGGVSAGGGLAAALALLTRDRAEIPLRFQYLDCPMLDDRQITHSSRLDGLPIWSRESNAFGWRAYLGDRYGTDDVPYTAAPARAEDLSGLPPAFVSVGTVDGFLDEDVDYALRMIHAGVPTEVHVYPGACHGYHLATDCEITHQSRRDTLDWLARQIRG